MIRAHRIRPQYLAASAIRIRSARCGHLHGIGRVSFFRPLEVFAEIVRVLKPGGVLAVTFSNRWFPPKVIKL